MAEKAKSPKSAKAKAPKPAVTKSANAPKVGKASKASSAPKAKGGSVKAVKAAARTKSKPQSIKPQSIETPSVETHVETFHVLLAPLPALIHSAKPRNSEQAIEFSSFAQAKERAIDHLIELIEEAERRLHLLRRATSHEEGRH